MQYHVAIEKLMLKSDLFHTDAANNIFPSYFKGEVHIYLACSTNLQKFTETN